MKIVIINGSARKGNTLTAINAFIKGASEKNEIEIIEPDKLNIAPCKGCGVCQCSKGCVDKDDTNPTIDKIAAADMILFATPVYWWGMSAQEMDPEDEQVQLQVRKLQDYITDHFYTCSDKILCGLGRMYAGGGELTENIDDVGGVGTAEFASKAIDIFYMSRR